MWWQPYHCINEEASCPSIVAGFPHLRTFAGMSFIGTAAGVLVHVITSQEEEGSKIEALKKSSANVAKELA